MNIGFLLNKNNIYNVIKWNIMKITEKELRKVISETIQKELQPNEPFDPYNYSFEGMSDDEFKSFYDDEDEAEMERELVDLISDGEAIFKRMREVIETSKYYAKSKDSDIIKKYLERIDSITNSIKMFWQ